MCMLPLLAVAATQIPFGYQRAETKISVAIRELLFVTTYTSLKSPLLTLKNMDCVRPATAGEKVREYAFMKNGSGFGASLGGGGGHAGALPVT